MDTSTQRAQVRRVALGWGFTAALALQPAAAAVVFNGWNAGYSDSRFAWSTDLYGPGLLGLPDIACVYPGASAICADTRYPHGTTTPGNLAPFTPIAGQQVQTQISRVVGGPMMASMTADLQAAGDIEGQVTHFRFENAVSSLSPYGYGLFTFDTADGSFLFGGVGAGTTLYYHYEWELDADATGSGFQVGYGVGVGGAQSGASNLGAQGLARSGSRSGSVVGQSSLGPALALSLVSPAAATATGTTSTAKLDFWITFSAQPVFGLPNPGGGGSVPEPPAWTLALVALGLLWRQSSRRATVGGRSPGRAAAEAPLTSPAAARS